MKCCICGKDAGRYGNNAMPLVNGRCCDVCNVKVIAARIKNTDTFYDELIAFSKKVNAMITETAGGECPQIYKVLLMHKMVYANVLLMKNINANVFDYCDALIDKILAENGEAVIKQHKYGDNNDL